MSFWRLFYLDAIFTKCSYLTWPHGVIFNVNQYIIWFHKFTYRISHVIIKIPMQTKSDFVTDFSTNLIKLILFLYQYF